MPGRLMSRKGAGRLAKVLRTAEKGCIVEALRKHGGHCGATAEALGIERSALYHKLRQYGLEGEAAGTD